MRNFLALLFLAGFAAQAAAQVQLRTLPRDAVRAKLSYLYDATVSLDGKERKLAAGAQIRDAENRIVVPSAVLGTVQVKFVADADGSLRQVWILTPDEAAQKDP